MTFISTHPESWSKKWENWHIIEGQYPNEGPFFITGNTRISINGSWFSAASGPGGSCTWSEEATVKKNLEFALSTEVITGWRAWRIVDFERRGNISEKRLQALGTSPVWEPYQANAAICTTVGTHEAPWPDCACGFWAFKEREAVERSLFQAYGGEKGKVIGQIALWGRVLECTNGYRGEYAYPQTLQFVDIDEKVAKDIAERYGAPYSIVKPSDKLKCEGSIVTTEYDFNRFYVTMQYHCGLEVRAEVSRNWEGKGSFDQNDCPPCPHHHLH